MEQAARDFDISIQEAGETIETFLSGLEEQNYLIIERNEGEENET